MSAGTMTRADHLAWAKTRALEYLPSDPQQAFTSMMSDLQKHPELENHGAIGLGAGLMMIPGWIDDERQVREFIVGFN